MRKTFFLLVGFYLFLSCASTQQKGFTAYGEVRTIKAQYSRVFNATRDYLLERGYRIINRNFETGDIETEYRPGAGWSYVGYTVDNRRAKVKAKVEKIDEVSAKLAMDIFCEVRSLDSGWQMIPGDNRDARIMYDRFYEGIIAKAQRRARE